MFLMFTLHLMLFSCIPFYFARQDGSVRSTSFYCYLAVLLVLANLGGSIYSIALTSTIAVSGGTLLYGAFMMTTVLFVIIERKVSVIRGIIRLVISVNLSMVVLSALISQTLRDPAIINTFDTSASVFDASLIVTSLGGILVITELVSMIFLFETIKSRVRNVLAVSLLYIATYILIICVDGLLFPLIINPLNAQWLADVSGDMPGNFILAASYGTTMLLFLVLFRKRLVEYMEQPLLLKDLLMAPRGELLDELERKNKSLLVSDQKFRNLAESIDDIFFSMDEGLRCTYWNKAAERSGHSAEFMVGKQLFDVFSSPKLDSLQSFYREVLRTGKPGRGEFVIATRGQDRDYDVSAYPFLAGVSVLVKDITERKEMEAQLLQSQRMESIGRLAGSVAHDFNNLLVPITANAELGMMYLAPHDKVHGHLKRITEAAEQAAGLTRQILAFSRKQVLQMQVLDLNAVVSEYGTMIQRLIGEDIRIQTTLDTELAPVNADRGQIEQVLLNLIVNARDAMPSGGTLTVSTANIILEEDRMHHGERQHAGRYCLLRVSDTGHGMNSDTRKKIFEPFFTTKLQGKGTGLGLATVYGIVRQHCGTITVDSESGVGTTFEVYLHQATGAVQVPTQEEPVNQMKAGRETILLVEDGLMVRNIIREGLQTYGYTVLDAQDVADGLRLAAEHDDIHLLLTDVVMPDMNGRELYEHVAALQPDMRVLFISGYTDDVIDDQGILEEGVNFLQKPFTIASLVQKIDSCLGQESARDVSSR